MTIERFTREEFEEVLDEIFDKWKPVNKARTELTYIAPIGNQKFITIQSSINRFTERADNTGENSIRVWVTNQWENPLMPKINHWTTRLPGWQDRLRAKCNY